MRFALRKPAPGDPPRREEIHLDSGMAGDNPPPAVQSLLQAIAADARPQEMNGFTTPLASYRAAFPMSRPTGRKTWRKLMLSPIGAAVAGLALALGGTAAAAYTGSLPDQAQDLAHTVIGAPAAHPTGRTTATGTATESSTPAATTATPSAKGTPVGPDASGPAAYGLCTAWTQHQSNGASTNGKADDSVAFKNLAAAAGGADKIGEYCAKVLASPKPTETSQPSADGTEASPNHPMGKPTAMPTQASTDHPGGKPTSVPPAEPTQKR